MRSHSQGDGSGYGAVHETARILDGFRCELAGDPTLTFNAGLVAGGTTVRWPAIAQRSFMQRLIAGPRIERPRP